eukprot:5251401-Amphidinium_carterae.1
MKPDTGWRGVIVQRQLHFSPLFVPVGAPEEHVTQVFWFFLAPDTRFSHSEGFVRSHCMPHASKSGINRTVGAFVSFVRALLKVPKCLRAKTGFQARKVRSLFSNLGEKSLIAESHLIFISASCHVKNWPSHGQPPCSKLRHPTRFARILPDGSSASTFALSVVPHIFSQRPSQSTG